jgi:hypothetical protein
MDGERDPGLLYGLDAVDTAIAAELLRRIGGGSPQPPVS